MKQGEILKKWVKEKGFTALEISDILGVSRQNMYNLYKESVLSNKYREILKDKGLSLDSVKSEVRHPGDTNDAAMIGVLSTTIQAMQDKIENLQDRYEKDIERIQILLNQQGEMITSLVKKALDQPEGKKLSIVNKK